MKLFNPRATKFIKDYYFDKETADLAVLFFTNYLVHIKGKYANKPLQLIKWQETIIRDLFGWKHKKTGLRRFREAYIEIPRKNGKSTLCAGIALLLLFFDKEEGAEIYSAGADREQAKIVFSVAKEMVLRNPALATRAKCWKDSIILNKRASFYKALSADADNKHGFNAHGIIFDELHVQPNRDLYDVLATSTGSREQPLMISITTAGHDLKSICYQKHQYAERILKGEHDDPSFYPVIYGLSPEDDWQDRKNWYKANPNLGISFTIEYLEKEFLKCKSNPREENTFKRLYLNMWTEQETRWLSMYSWKKAGDKKYDDEFLKTLDCYIGADLSQTTDLTSIVQAFNNLANGEVILKPAFWLPEEQIDLKSRQDNFEYRDYEKSGHIFLSAGNVVDYDGAFEYIEKLKREGFNIKEIGYDPWNSVAWALKLQSVGYKAVEVRQGYRTMNEASKEFERLVLNQGLVHMNHPILNWNASNASVKTDPTGSIMPVKGKSNGRIDGISASVIALSRIILNRNAEFESVYSKRGLTVL